MTPTRLLRMCLPVAAAAMIGVLSAGPAAAQGGPRLTFELGAGARVAPEYPGSDSYKVLPTGRFGFRDLTTLPGGLVIGSSDARPLDTGFGITGTARYLGARSAVDHPELAGLERVRSALELGLALRHVGENWRVFGELRYGVLGHKAWVGDLGADVILRPAPGWTFNAGPRVTIGDGRFKRTYFGITEAESVLSASNFDPFRPSAGVVSVGLEAEVRRDLTEDWAIIGTVSYDRLRDDAGRSPITALGSRDQWGARVMVTRRFSFGF